MKKKYFVTVCVFFLFHCTSFAQPPAIEWQKTFGGTVDDEATDIQQTSDGGFIISGFTYSTDGDVPANNGAGAYWIVKTDAAGTMQWQKIYGSNNGQCRAYSIKQTTDGGYIVAGYGVFTVGFDYFIVKLDSSGNTQWQQIFESQFSEETAASISETADGGYVLCGYQGMLGGILDSQIIKLDNSGIIEWQQSFGGTGLDYLYSIVQTADGGYIAAGSSNSDDGGIDNHGNYDYWVVRLDASGVLQWQKTYGGTDNDQAKSICLTTDGGYIISGFSQSTDGDVTNNNGNEDYWILKLDLTGNIQWQKTYGDTNFNEAVSTQPTSEGGYIISGSFFGFTGWDYHIIKIDGEGTQQWEKELGGNGDDFASGIRQTSDGGFIIAGSTYSNDGDVTANHGSKDYWIVKLSPALAIDAFNQNQLISYPNPAISIINLQTVTSHSLEKVIITDLTGKIVMEQTQNTKLINVQKLASGMYMLQAFSGGKKFEGKFIKE